MTKMRLFYYISEIVSSEISERKLNIRKVSNFEITTSFRKRKMNFRKNCSTKRDVESFSEKYRQKVAFLRKLLIIENSTNVIFLRHYILNPYRQQNAPLLKRKPRIHHEYNLIIIIRKKREKLQLL